MVRASVGYKGMKTTNHEIEMTPNNCKRARIAVTTIRKVMLFSLEIEKRKNYRKGTCLSSAHFNC